MIINEYKEFEYMNSLSERNNKIKLSPLKFYETIDKFKFSFSSQNLFDKNIINTENNKFRKTINFNKIKENQLSLNKLCFTSQNLLQNSHNFSLRSNSLRNITFGTEFLKDKKTLYVTKKISALCSPNKITKKNSIKKPSFITTVKEIIKKHSSIFNPEIFLPHMLKLEKLKHRNKKNKIFLYKDENNNENLNEEDRIIKTEKDYKNYVNTFFDEFKEQIKIDDNKLNYGKKLCKNLNNKIFKGIINDCKELELKLDNNLNCLFEKEVKEYQLAHIYELNEKIRNGESINAIKSLDNLNEFEKQAYKGTYFYVRNEQDELSYFKDNQSDKLNFENKNNKSIEQIETKNDENLRIIKNKQKDLFNKLKKYKKEKIKLYNVKGGEEFITHLNYSHGANHHGLDEEGMEKLSKQSYIELCYINNNENFNLFGIMDGHGTNCHLITNFINKYINEYFIKKKKDNKSLFKEDMSLKEIYSKITKNKYEFIYKLINKIQEALLKYSNINCSFTGSTCLLLFIIGNNIICSNIGDSCAIIVEKNEILQLTVSQKNFEEEEKKRIENYDIPNSKETERTKVNSNEFSDKLNKDVFYLNNNGSTSNLKANKNRKFILSNIKKDLNHKRIFSEKKNKENNLKIFKGKKINFENLINKQENINNIKKDIKLPLINISRSLGDFELRKLGVLSDPVITEYILNKKSRYIVIGTNSLFKYLNNKKIAEAVYKGYEKGNPIESCRFLGKKYNQAYLETDIPREEMTCIVLFF